MREGWVIEKLGEVVSFERGLTYSKGDEVAKSSIGVLRSNNVDLTTQSLNLDDIKYLREDFEVPDKKKVKKSSLLMCMSNGSKDHLGKVALIDRDLDYAFGGFMGLLTPEEGKVFPKYLYYALASSSFKDYIRGLADGANINNLKYKDLAAFNLLLPPIAEQRRIVDLLDKEFAKIDTLKANAEKSVKASKDLFISTLTKELKHRKGWKETRIGEFCEIVRGKRFVRADIVEKGVPCIHYGDIYTHYGLSATQAKGCVSPDLAKKLRFANKNDVVVVAAGENRMDIGVGVAWLGNEPAVVHDACFILRHSQNPMFLSFYFRSSEYHNYLKDEVNEGKICSFLTKPLAEARISLPPLQEQEQIVARLEIVYSNCEAMKDNYQRTCILCGDLKQSFLRMAFNGEL